MASRPSDDVDGASGTPDADPWAEAFAESSRLGAVPPPPAPQYAVATNSEVQYFVELFTGSRREVVNLWAGRSGRYLGMMREVMRAKGLPEDLVYTAMIESGFNPTAVSRVGAKGLWQFMAPTARRYGLRVDQWVDERFDPEKSTKAAAGYLRDLYSLFGSWDLAQAAYNAGEVKVARAIRLGRSQDFWELARTKYLRRETKDFVPQIHAATVIGRDPDRYGIGFGDLAPLPVDTVTVPPGTDLRRLAAATGITLGTLRSLNPVLVRAMTPPRIQWTLRVPTGAREGVLTALAPKPKTPPTAVAVARASHAGHAAPHRDNIHVVRPRDTVSSIAKRYGVSVNDVLRWNRLAQQDRIHPGDRLRVAALRPSIAEREGQGGFR